MEVNEAGVIVSPPDLFDEYRLNDREYYRVEYHILDNGRCALRYIGELKDSGFAGPASINNTYPSFSEAKEKALSIARKAFRGTPLLELIEHESRQLDLFREAM